jgi:hypothetical protein
MRRDREAHSAAPDCPSTFLALKILEVLADGDSGRLMNQNQCNTVVDIGLSIQLTRDCSFNAEVSISKAQFCRFHHWHQSKHYS